MFRYMAQYIEGKCLGMTDILVYACFNPYGASRQPLLAEMFNHDIDRASVTKCIILGSK